MKRYLYGMILLAPLCGTADATLVNYSIQRLGFTGASYTRTGQYQFSQAESLNDLGQVVGFSQRYSGSIDLGQDAWLYADGTTTQLGFTGLGYEKSYGYRNSVAAFLNEQGLVAGYSLRYSGTSSRGADAWLYEGGVTVQLGFTGTGYEQTNGYRLSGVSALNEQGQVAGVSERYSGNGYYGRDAWLYDGGTMKQLGFTGAGYEGTNGSRYSDVGSLNNQGQVTGLSFRYSGTADRGWDAWLYDGTSAKQLGFIGVGYEQTNGFRRSAAAVLNEQGQVVGISQRYSGTADLGTDAWLYDGSATTKQLGFTGTGYERADGYRSSGAYLLNEQGQAAGSSNRYSGTENLGQDAWLYDGTNTLQLGFTGDGYEKTDGYRYSYARALNDQGQVAGYSDRYSATSDQGQDAWLYDGSSMRQLGYTGIGYVGYDEEQNFGYRRSDVSALNDKGQVAGSSARYSETWDPAGGNQLGQDAWLYDLTLDQTFNLTLSVRPTDDYAYSFVEYLSEDGVALGSYSLFDQMTGDDLGLHAFYFSIDDGLYDLGLLVEDLSEDGWQTLAYAVANQLSTNNISDIIGNGKLLGINGQAAYLLTPTAAVPIPAAVWMFASGLGLLGWMKRRQSA